MCDLCFTYVVLDDGLKVGTFMINLRRFDLCFFAVLKRRAQAHHNEMKIFLKDDYYCILSPTPHLFKSLLVEF